MPRSRPLYSPAWLGKTPSRAPREEACIAGLHFNPTALATADDCVAAARDRGLEPTPSRTRGSHRSRKEQARELLSSPRRSPTSREENRLLLAAAAGGPTAEERVQRYLDARSAATREELGGGTAVARWRSTWYSSRDQNSRGSAPPGARYTCNGM